MVGARTSHRGPATSPDPAAPVLQRHHERLPDDELAPRLLGDRPLHPLAHGGPVPVDHREVHATLHGPEGVARRHDCVRVDVEQAALDHLDPARPGQPGIGQCAPPCLDHLRGGVDEHEVQAGEGVRWSRGVAHGGSSPGGLDHAFDLRHRMRACAPPRLRPAPPRSCGAFAHRVIGTSAPTDEIAPPRQPSLGHSVVRSPEARATRRATAPRTASSDPTRVTPRWARVTAV